MSKDPTERKKYSRYLKSAEDNLKKAVLLDDYSNRGFTIITKISESAKYRSRNPIKIIKGANYELGGKWFRFVGEWQYPQVWRRTISTCSSMSQNHRNVSFLFILLIFPL